MENSNQQIVKELKKLLSTYSRVTSLFFLLFVGYIIIIMENQNGLSGFASFFASMVTMVVFIFITIPFYIVLVMLKKREKLKAFKVCFWIVIILEIIATLFNVIALLFEII